MYVAVCETQTCITPSFITPPLTLSPPPVNNILTFWEDEAGRALCLFRIDVKSVQMRIYIFIIHTYMILFV